MSVTINEAEISRWLTEAQPGHSIQYFQGFLALGTDSTGLLLSEPQTRAVASVAAHLWRAAHHNMVHLLQRREGPSNWTYIAVARPLTALGSGNGNSSHMESRDG